MLCPNCGAAISFVSHISEGIINPFLNKRERLQIVTIIFLNNTQRPKRYDCYAGTTINLESFLS